MTDFVFRQWNDADYLMTGGQGCVNRTAAGLHCPGQTDTECVTLPPGIALGSGTQQPQ